LHASERKEGFMRLGLGFFVGVWLGKKWALARGRAAGGRAQARAHAIVPRELVEGPRHLAAAIARRARDLSN
jgi:hypothetical protein